MAFINTVVVLQASEVLCGQVRCLFLQSIDLPLTGKSDLASAMIVKMTDFGDFNYLSRSGQRDCKAHVVPRTLKESALGGGLIAEQAPFPGILSACLLPFL